MLFIINCSDIEWCLKRLVELNSINYYEAMSDPGLNYWTRWIRIIAIGTEYEYNPQQLSYTL